MKSILKSLATLALASSVAWADTLTWDFAFSPDDITLTPRGEYTILSLSDGSNPRDAIGAPAIPAKFANILLPDGATDVSVSATGDLVLLASDITPWPVQRVAPKSKPQPPFTAPDPAAYASATPWPAAVATYEGLHDMQGSTFVSVRVNPLVYVASEKALYYRPSVSVAVSYTPDSSSAPRAARSVSQNTLATEMVNALVVNPESTDSPSALRRRAAARAATVDYLIITSSTLSNAFQNLASYRATPAGGSFKALVVTTNTIASSYSGDDIQMKIRNCISNYVKSSGTTYVVLGGDDSVVPDRDCYGNVDNETYEWHMPTDLYYSDLTGTWKASGNTNFGVVKANVDMSPDVIVGRIPVRTAAQLSGYLAKVQAFEADTSHTRNSIIMGGPAAWCRYYANKRPSDNVTGDGHAAFRASNHTYVSDSEMWNRRLFRDGIYTNWSRVESSITMKIACDSITSWDSSTCGDKALSSSNLKTWLNNGYTHFMFSGHGYPQGWGMETSGNYSTSQASSQTNLVAFVFTDACLTGAFDEDGIKSSGITVDYGTSDQYTYTSEPCLGEAFIRNADGGALVHMGCARYGWGTPDASNGTSAEDSDGYYTNYTATTTSDGGPSTVYAYKFYKRLYESAAVNSNRTVGAAFAMSKADMISECSSDGCERWIQYGLNYLGDPAIALYPRAAADIAPEFSSSTAATNTVKGETVYFDFSELLAAGYPDPTYTITSSVSSSLWTAADELLEFTPNATGSFTFTCTASNSEGTATCVLTVTVTLPQPDTPSTPSVVGSDSFTATWTAVSGASRYELVVVEGASGGGSGGGSTLTETFANATFTPGGGNYVNQTISDGDLGEWTATSCRGDLGVPAFRYAGTLTSPSIAAGVASVEFDYEWPYSESGNCNIDLYINGTQKDTATVTGGTAGTATYSSFNAVTGASTIEFRNTATSNKRMKVTEVRITTAGSTRALPRAAGDVVFSNSVGNVTSYQVTGLQPDTTYSFSYRAIVNGEATPWSEPAAVTTAEGDSAPVWSATFPSSVSTNVGDFYTLENVSSYVSGSPTPTITLDAPAGLEAELASDTFTFAAEAAGTYTFTFTASNSEGSATATLTVTVSAAPVTVPTLLVGDETATSAYATWDACTGVTSYTLQLASDDQFSTGGSGGTGGTLTETFANASFTTTSSSYTDQTISGGDLGTWTATSCRGDSTSPIIRYAGTLTSPTIAAGVASVEFDYDWPYTESGSCDIELYVGGTSQGTATVTGGTSGTATYTLASPVSGPTTIELLNKASSTKRMRVTEVRIGTPSSGASGEGSLILEETVSDTEYTFTGLTPETTYYARVKGDSDWSNVAEFTTESAGDTAPAWSATFPSAVSTNVGDFYTLANVSSYVSGSPAPSISLTAPAGLQASLEDDTFLFGPEASGSYTFTFTASNSIGTATATLVVTAVGQAPELTASQGTSIAATVGEPVSFTVTATGIPAPTVTMAATEYAATFANGAFSFTPAAAGTYAFSFNASNGEGTDSLVVTVTASAAPVTIPELSVTNITDTTALATWTACDGVSSYTLQLSTNDFPAASGAARSATPILSEDFSGFSGNGNDDIASNGTLNDHTSTTGWTGFKVYTASETAKVGASSGQGWIMTPALDASGTLTVVWSAYRYGTSDKNTLLLGVSANGTDFDEETIPLGDEMTGYTNTFTVAGPTVYVRWMASGSSKARFYLDNVHITNPGGGGSGGDTPAGDDIQEFAVSGTSHTFTNLTPFTVYYARVKGDSYWSNTEEFLTDEATPSGTAPSWSASFPTNWNKTAGDIDGFDVADYLSGDPAPAVTLATDAPAGDYTFSNGEFYFLPTHTGTYTFTFTASNSLGTADATLTANVTGSAPVWQALPAQTFVADGNGECALNLTSYVSGSPAPVISQTTGNDISDFDPADDNYFYFTTTTPGTYGFTFTASNVLGTADATLTVTVTEVPVVTVPPTLTLDPATTAYEVTAGDPDIDFAVTATGTPDPTVTATCTEGAYFVFENGEFIFEPDTAGTYHFVFTASNSAGTDTATVTVTVAEAEVPIPTLAVTNVTDTTALATWTACTGVTSYRLQLATDTNFTAGGFTSLLTENFDGVTGNSSGAISSLDGVTAVSGWTCANAYSNTGCLRMGKGSGAGSLVTPSIEVSGTLRVVWSGVSWTNDDTHVYVGYSVNGTDFTELEIGLTGDMVGYTNTFEITGTTSLQVRWRSSKASNQRFFIDGIEISGGSPAGGASGSLVFDSVVTGTNHTFTGLSPDTLYYARVQAEDGAYWSNVYDFITEQGDTPPPADPFEAWLALHNSSGHTAAQDAPNGYTYWQNYVADVDPSHDDFLEVDFAETAGYIAIKNASTNRYYQLLVYEDLMDDPVVYDLGTGSEGMTVEFPVDDETFFARVQALLEAPTAP